MLLRMEGHPVIERRNPEIVNRVAELLERSNVDPNTIDRIRDLKFKSYGIAAKVKGVDGVERLQTEGLYSTTFSADPAAPSVEFAPRKSKIIAYNPVGIRNAKNERIFTIGDLQLGFWSVLDPLNPKRMVFQPFHDEAALDVVMQALALYQPDRIVIIGDYFDYPQMSRFQQEIEWAQTMQATIQEGYDLLCKIRATCPNAKIDYIPGNHELRMTKAIVNNNPALYNLKRPGDAHSIYSVPSLMRFDELKIECAAEYPSGEVWLAKRNGNRAGLVATHAPSSAKDMRADTIHGHLVMPSLNPRQVFYEDGPVTYWQMCVSGCGNYSDTSSKVRITRTNTPSGRSRMGHLHSFGTVDIDRESGLRAYGLHHIQNGEVQFLGKIISARKDTAA